MRGETFFLIKNPARISISMFSGTMFSGNMRVKNDFSDSDPAYRKT